MPEFPGQTHAFFWRELTELHDAGADVDILSTRRPDSRIVSHAWAGEAARRTRYLNRPNVGMVLRSGRVLARALVSGRLRKAVGGLRSGEEGAREKISLIAAGALLAARAHQRGWRHVHVHSCGSSALVAWTARALDGISYSLTLHGPLADYGPRQEQKWRDAAFVLVITEKLLTEARAALGDAVAADVAIAPMGVRIDEMRRSRAYEPWDPSSTLQLFSCGRLNAAKGHDTLISAAGLLSSRGIPVRLTIAGEDDEGGTGYRKQLEAHVRQLGLDASVHLLGAVDEASVRDQLSAAHIFALASHGEPLGVAIMEAMAMGTPVVIGDGGGVRELVDESSGVLVDPESPTAFAEAILRVAENPAAAARMAEHARRRVVARFSSKASADLLLGKIVAAGIASSRHTLS